MALFAALTLVVGSCGSDDDELVPPVREVPEYLKEGTESRPAWTVANKSYEVYMTIQVQLGDTLAHYQGTGDLMSATINGEVRAVVEPKTTGGETYFPLTIGAEDATGTINLQYYCNRLRRIYTLNYWATFDPTTKPTGEDGIYRPRFTGL